MKTGPGVGLTNVNAGRCESARLLCWPYEACVQGLTPCVVSLCKQGFLTSDLQGSDFVTVSLALLEGGRHVGVYDSDGGVHHFDDEGVHKHSLSELEHVVVWGKGMYAIRRAEYALICQSLHDFGQYKDGAAPSLHTSMVLIGWCLLHVQGDSERCIPCFCGE